MMFLNLSLLPSKTANSLSTIFHILALFHHATILRGFAEIELDLFDEPIVVRTKPFRFVTLTGWSFAAQLSHVVLSLAVEWQHWRGARADERLIKTYGPIKDTLFRSVVLPSTALVSLLFWTLCSIDRELIYPQAWDAVVPRWVNQGVHSATALITCVELMMTRTAGDRAREANWYWVFSGGYAVILYSIYIIHGVWLYPFLATLSLAQLCLFQSLYFCAGRSLLELVWWIDSRTTLVKVD